MAQHLPRPDHSPDPWLRRLDRAAGRMNPFLVVLAIGLAILNLTCLALVAAQLPITRQTPGSADVPASLASRERALARIRSSRWKLPPDWKFDREEANSR